MSSCKLPTAIVKDVEQCSALEDKEEELQCESENKKIEWSKKGVEKHIKNK